VARMTAAVILAAISMGLFVTALVLAVLAVRR
jgi:hypothetical protein